MRLVWTGLASLDRKEIREYIAQDNPAAAVALDALISEKAARLIDHSGLGRLGRVAGTRELIAHQNYIILIYDITLRPGFSVRAACSPRCPTVAAELKQTGNGLQGYQELQIEHISQAAKFCGMDALWGSADFVQAASGRYGASL